MTPQYKIIATPESVLEEIKSKYGTEMFTARDLSDNGATLSGCLRVLHSKGLIKRVGKTHIKDASGNAQLISVWQLV